MLSLMTLSESLKASFQDDRADKVGNQPPPHPHPVWNQSKVTSEVPFSLKVLCLCPCSVKVLLKGIWHSLSAKSTFEFKKDTSWGG